MPAAYRPVSASPRQVAPLQRKRRSCVCRSETRRLTAKSREYGTPKQQGLARSYCPSHVLKCNDTEQQGGAAVFLQRLLVWLLGGAFTRSVVSGGSACDLCSALGYTAVLHKLQGYARPTIAASFGPYPTRLCRPGSRYENCLSRVSTVTGEALWLDMAVGALRAAGIAAAALGYHVWRLLTKQDTSTLEELQESEEVLHGHHSFCC